ncbi:MAG: hypothetical protein IKJ45_06895, partial [Kiritimatiellae bacterium]|nr:hypothetical protein [Kiritimatiellia bacterium]
MKKVLNAFALVALAAVPFAAESKGVPAALYDHAEPINLPELMKTSDGRDVRTVKEWETLRRPEILKFATENIYGVRPVERPSDLKFEQMEPD